MSKCAMSILACGFRATKLDDVGNVADEDDNFYVTNNLITIGTTPEIEAGQDITQKGGCDCIIGSYRGPDLFKRFNFEVQLGKMEFALLSLLTGGALITDGTGPGDNIGMFWPEQLSCSDTPPPNVAIEVWSNAWEDDAPNEDYAYLHWVWPFTKWQFGPAELGATSFFLPSLTGFSRSNPRWGEGPYGDGPPDGSDVAGQLGVWLTNDPPPDSACEFGTVVPSS